VTDPCVFCEIVAGRAPAADLRSTRAWETSEVFSFLPLGPVTPGHRLFVPKRHILDAADYPEVAGETFEAAAWWARRQGGPFNLITSAGAEATQTVLHLHVHYVPRHDGDGLHLPWTGQAEREEAARREVEAARNRKLVVSSRLQSLGIEGVAVGVGEGGAIELRVQVDPPPRGLEGRYASVAGIPCRIEHVGAVRPLAKEDPQ
jgi:histidine triad (HIT) family protein